MKVVEFGYAGRGSEDRLRELMQDEKAILCDIRLSPRSRWQPAWNQDALIAQWGDRYIHLPELGNKNYRPEDRAKGIELADAGAGLRDLEAFVLNAGYTAVVMCACKSYSTCHRHVVCEALAHNRVETQI